MNILFRKSLTAFFILASFNSFGQDEKSNPFDKNSLDLQCLGNKGFIAIGYNRIVFEKENLYLTIGPALGFVPGSHEDTLNSIPNFTHLNFGASVVYAHLKYRFAIGTGYSRIIVGDMYHARPKSSYNRVLGEFGIIRYFPKDEFGIKLAFTPMLYDDGADDIESIPVSFTFQIDL